MISVPDAGLLPSTPRPVRCMNGSITSNGKPVRIGRHRLRRDDAHQLPVAGRRVLALRALDEPARDRRRSRLRRAALERLDVAEPERLEIRQVEAADGAGDVAERVRSLVAVLGGVRQRARADGVQHDDARAGHAGYSRSVMEPSSACSASSSSSSRVISLAAGVTWLVVKLFPHARPKKPAGAPELRSRLRPATAGGRPRAARTRGRAPRRPPRT